MINKEEFCDLIREYKNSIYYVAYSVVKNDADAEEIISESIYKAYSKLNTLTDTAAFKTWLLRIVHNTAVDYIKKNGKYFWVENQEETEEESKENEIVTKLVVRDAVNQLRQPYRTIIGLYYFEDLSIEEIAKVTNKSQINIRKQLSRGRNMLKEILKGEI